MVNVRDATLDDFETLVFLGERMREESLEPYPPIDRAHARRYVGAALARPDIALFCIAEQDGIPVGMMAAAAGPYCFSPEMRAASDLLFVLPEYRGSMAAKRLVSRFAEWSDSIGATSATLTVATGVTPERTGKFFELMGFESMATLYERKRG